MDRCYWLHSGDWVAWLCVLHVVRCDLRPGQESRGCRRCLPARWRQGCWFKFFLLVGKRLFSVAFGPGRAGGERSSDRLLTVGVDVAGRQAAPRAGPEWQARHGRELPLPGGWARTGCCSAAAASAWAVADAVGGGKIRSALAGGRREAHAGQWTWEFQMV